MTAQELNLSRRSIQFFDKNKDVDMDLVRRVIEEATYAPSSRNLQPWRVIVVRSEEAKNKLYPLANKQQKILDAALTLIIVGDLEPYGEHNSVWNDIKKLQGEEQGTEAMNRMKQNLHDNELAKSRLMYTNTGLYSMNLMTLFKAYGMDSHPIGGMNRKAVHQEFGLQDHEDVVMLLSVGYHDESKAFITRKRRKNYKEIATEL